MTFFRRTKIIQSPPVGSFSGSPPPLQPWGTRPGVQLTLYDFITLEKGHFINLNLALRPIPYYSSFQNPLIFDYFFTFIEIFVEKWIKKYFLRCV